MRTQLEPLVEGLYRAESLEALQSAIVGLRDHLDIEHLIYHSINSTGQQYAALTYSPSWVDRYISEDYAKIDPVVQGCFRRFSPVDWRDLDWTSRPVRRFLGEAIDAGVGSQGFSIPIRGPNGQFALFTISDRRSDREWEKYTSRRASELILLAHFINQKALEIERGTDLSIVNGLSPREVDVLTRLALGESRAQAADHLKISEHTLRAYVESARFKLGASNTTHTVARALSLGLIVI
jgi:DNA-binding CsgD family transcriptional regulator